MYKQNLNADPADLNELIRDLGNANNLTRQRARLLLVDLKERSVPALIATLQSRNAHARWEAVRTLSQIGNPETAPALSNMLLDDDIGVRWAAMEGLINLGRDSLKPMLELYLHNFDSTWMREGVHHVLHVLRDCNKLNPLEVRLYEELSRQDIPGFMPGWNKDQVWAAEKALEVLDSEAAAGSGKQASSS